MDNEEIPPMNRLQIEKWRENAEYDDLWFFVVEGKVSESPVPLHLVPREATHVLNVVQASAENPPWIAVSDRAMPPTPKTPNPPSKRLSTICILSAIFSALGIFPLIFVGAIAGIVLGIVGINIVRNPENDCRGEIWATAGLSVGCVGLLLWGAIMFTSDPSYNGGSAGGVQMQADRYPAAIEKVLDRATRISLENGSVANVPEQMRRIDLSRTPNDFREAYISWVHAWEGLAEVERQADAVAQHYSSDDAMAEAFIRGVMGDPFGKVSEQISDEQWVQNRFETAIAEINRTGKRIERVAARYGGETP